MNHVEYQLLSSLNIASTVHMTAAIGYGCTAEQLAAQFYEDWGIVLSTPRVARILHELRRTRTSYQQALVESVPGRPHIWMMTTHACRVMIA